MVESQLKKVMKRNIHVGKNGKINSIAAGGRRTMDLNKKKIAFICVHNSCRSQIAEALGKHLAGDRYDFYSAGTETKPQINQDAVRLMKELYGIDMENEQFSKTIDQIPDPDYAISMGCGVSCPFIGHAFDEDWGLEDPTGKEDETFIQTIKTIEDKIRSLSV